MTFGIVTQLVGKKLIKLNMKKMTIEEIATQVMAGILANPRVLDSFNDPNTIIENVTRASIGYAKELKRQLGEYVEVVDVDFEIINE